MQPRSKSAQQRKQDREQHELQRKLNWVLNQNCLPFTNPPKAEPTSGELQNYRNQHSHTRQTIRKVESIENVQLVKMKTAIDELQLLVTPTIREEAREDWTASKQRLDPNAESFIYQEGQPAQEAKVGQHQILGQQNQTVQYYKQENKKLKMQLQGERKKNEECVAIIKKLESTNLQLEKEVNLLLYKYQNYHPTHTQNQKIKELQNSLKEQLMINLKLEEVMLKNNLKKKEGVSNRIDEQYYKSLIGNLENELNERKREAEKDSAGLKAIIEEKYQEIKHLQLVISNQNEEKARETPITLPEIESPTFTNINSHNSNYLQRFANFSKEMEARISVQQNFVSTHPSIQDMNEFENHRKKSESLSSKGNCLSLTIPEKRSINRPSSKTDRL